MRTVKNLTVFVFIILFAVFLSINSQIIDLRFIPGGSNLPGVVISLPAYVVMLIFIGFGLCLGTLFEYFRTWRERLVSRHRSQEIQKLNAKIKYLTNEKTSETEQILGLLK